MDRMKELNKVLEDKSRRATRTLGKKEAAVYKAYYEVHHKNGTPWIVGATLPGLTGYKDVGGIGKILGPGVKERRADLIHHENGIMKVVEFKEHLDHQAVGQVLLYTDLIQRHWQQKKEVKAVIAGKEIESDVALLCEKLGIRVELFGLDEF